MDSLQYFGVPRENMRLAEMHAGMFHHLRLNTHVPSRSEVATLPPAELRTVLLDWMMRSATEIIPSRAQIHEVLIVLRARSDITQLTDISEMCSNYISGE
ncbi:MAG: hypothetical protein GAK35_01999 [Herbaspirillum frisingense]|uniref:Uncharacterized protein n=1 Tax=Herbaspirillum frisingense TaxID=92645 RepID=A0A7V8FWY5_9BURK|nr:MAG: hypothetical protein GAK35_01999 [Herbaspirillum frisingense]